MNNKNYFIWRKNHKQKKPTQDVPKYGYCHYTEKAFRRKICKNPKITDFKFYKIIKIFQTDLKNLFFVLLVGCISYELFSFAWFYKRTINTKDQLKMFPSIGYTEIRILNISCGFICWDESETNPLVFIRDLYLMNHSYRRNKCYEIINVNWNFENNFNNLFISLKSWTEFQLMWWLYGYTHIWALEM